MDEREREEGIREREGGREGWRGGEGKVVRKRGGEVGKVLRERGGERKGREREGEERGREGRKEERKKGLKKGDD